MATLKIKPGFKKLLDENDAFSNYVFALRDRLDKNTEEEKNIILTEINTADNFCRFIMRSFDWAKTVEGPAYWIKISNLK